MKSHPAGITTVLVVLAGLVAWRPFPVDSSCIPVANRWTPRLKATAVEIISSPNRASDRAEFNIPFGTPSDVVVIEADSVCRAGVITINRHRHVADTVTRHVSAVRIGRFVMMLDTLDRAGEWTQNFLMDSALTKVYRVYGR